MHARSQLFGRLHMCAHHVTADFIQLLVCAVPALTALFTQLFITRRRLLVEMCLCDLIADRSAGTCLRCISITCCYPAPTLSPHLTSDWRVDRDHISY